MHLLWKYYFSSKFYFIFLLYFFCGGGQQQASCFLYQPCPVPIPPITQGFGAILFFWKYDHCPLNDNKLSIFSIWSPASERLDLVPNQHISRLCVRITDVDRNSHGVCWEPISCVQKVGSLQDEMSKESRDLYVKRIQENPDLAKVTFFSKKH